MIAQLVRFCVKRSTMVLSIAAVFAVIAGVMGSSLTFDAVPDVTGKQVVVLTRAQGLTPEEVELLVTRPIETSLGGLPDMKEQRSISRYGISSVTAIFNSDADLFRARQMVQERLQAVSGDLPAGVDAPELGPLTGGLGEIYHFSLHSPTRTPAELFELAELRIAPLLASVSGVVEVNTWGGHQRTLDVIGIPEKMAQHKITLEQLHEAVRSSVGDAPGASIEIGTQGVLLRGISRPQDAADLGASVALRHEDGTLVRLSQIAEIREGSLPRIGAATADGNGEVVYVMVQMLLDADALAVLRDVHDRMDLVRSTLPADVVLDEVYDRSELVYATLNTVLTNLVEGGLLVVIVLFLTLGSFRAGLLVASVIPLSMLGAVAAMVVFEVPGNLMSLGALDFGLLVDGAVVMVEGVFHVYVLKGGNLSDQVEESTSSVARPVFFSISIILLVYIPILALQGVEGAMFRPMALTVVFALLSSLILSLTFVPAAAKLILRNKDVPKREPLLIRGARRLYEPVLTRALAHPLLVILISLSMLAGGVVLFSRAGSSFVPQLDEGDLVLQTTRAPDIHIGAATADASEMEAAILAKVPEVRHVVSRIGSPAVATDIMGLEQADVFVDLRPKSEWRSGLTRDELIEEIDAAIQTASPAEDVAFTQPIQMRFNELVGGEATDVSLSIYGEDLEELRRLADLATEIISGVEGSADVRVSAPPAVRVLEVKPRHLQAGAAGFSADSLLAHVTALRVGLESGLTYDGPLAIPVRVKLQADVDALRVGQMKIPTEDGRLLPLQQLAKVEEVSAPALVNRYRAQRRLVVGFNVRGKDLGTVVEAAQKRINAELALPDGIRLEWGGQYEGLQRARARLAIVVPVVLVSILLLLLWLFRNLRPALLILLNVPFAAVGGIVLLSMRDMPISISAAIGFIALSGIAVLNGVVLVSALVKEEENGHSAIEAARRAAQGRMRPVLMTALVAALGFIPMTVATGVGAEVQRPLATVVVGGLITSTLLTLLILPSLIPWLEKFKRAKAK